MAGLNWPANHAIGFWKLGALALDRLLIRFGWIGPAEMWEKRGMGDFGIFMAGFSIGLGVGMTILICVKHIVGRA